VKLFIHSSVLSSIHGWHHTAKKTLAEVNNPTPPTPLLCACIAVYKRHARPQGGTPKILISISATNPTYICHLWSFPMVSCMLLFHGSQVVQTSRFSAARVLMNTCGMWYIERFGNVICSCNFVIGIVKYTHLCISHRVQTMISIWQYESGILFFLF
jgi:hypothetical protein